MATIMGVLVVYALFDCYCPGLVCGILVKCLKSLTDHAPSELLLNNIRVKVSPVPSASHSRVAVRYALFAFEPDSYSRV